MRQPPDQLFKYLPAHFAAGLIERGELLFRNLAYFRKAEQRGRADLLESLHVDRPDHLITIDNLSRGTRWVGRAACLNGINADGVFVFCLSTRLGDDLFDEFTSPGSETMCVEITNVTQFFRRIETAVQQQFPEFSELGHGPALYYAPDRATPHNIKAPWNIPFFKHEGGYAHQAEYRIVLPLPGALTLTTRIVNELFSWDEEVAAGVSDQRLLVVGSLADITQVRKRSATTPRGVP